MKPCEILDRKIRSIVQREREALSELITELKNLDAIRGYVDLRFRSMFDYLTKGLGYSAGAAQRRIDACRLAREVADLPARIEAGKLDFHHVTTVSRALRQIKRKVSADEKRELFAKLEFQSESQTQKAVAEFFDIRAVHEVKRLVQRDSSVRIELTISRELAQKIEHAQALISHSVPTRDLACFLEYVSEKIIKQKSTAMMAVSKCVNCGSSWFLQKDHIKSRWLGGGDQPENLQTLCGPCNRAKYRREKEEVGALTV